MSRKLSRVALIVVLLSTWLIGGFVLSGPAHSVAKSGDFTAAEKVLSKSGTTGVWTFQEPPGAPPVTCAYPADTGTLQFMVASGPIVFPADGLSSQTVGATLTVNRRLPDGSLVPMGTSFAFSDTATKSDPYIGSPFAPYRDLGSTFVFTAQIYWYTNGAITGQVNLLYTQYQTTVLGSPNQTLPVTAACYPAAPAVATLASSQGNVGAPVGYQIFRFPQDPNVGIYFDGTKIGSVATDFYGNAAGSFVVPAAPMGLHTVKFYRYGRTAKQTFTIKPRIKLFPSTNLTRGQTVNVSLRGYAANETVSIRWKKGTSWVQVGQVKTSSTGSANIDIHVPSFAVIGTNSVRGDGTYGHAQTSAVTVVASASSSSTTNASPTPTKTATPTKTPTPVPSAIPATPTPMSTPSPTVEVSTPEPTETPVATSNPEATEPATPAPVGETATLEPTTEPSPASSPGAGAPGEDAG
jgi:hypothetical protein